MKSELSLGPSRSRLYWLVFLSGVLAAIGLPALAHDVAGQDVIFMENVTGPEIGPFIYLGAKHMFTGYDHLLFLAGVIFFIYRMREVVKFVTLFAIGHSITLLYGVLAGVQISPYIIDAIIGLSVVYKAFDNLGGFQRFIGVRPDPRAMVFAFGLFHGFGLAASMQEVDLPREGLVANIISFNIGVELGQIAALVLILAAMNLWRSTDAFRRQAVAANVLIMAAGFVLFQYQIFGFFLEG